MASTKYNPEKRTWRGKSYKKGAELVTSLREVEAAKCPVCGQKTFRIGGFCSREHEKEGA